MRISPGSPSQIERGLVAARRATWRSRQLYEALSFPPTNHFAYGGFHSSTFVPLRLPRRAARPNPPSMPRGRACLRPDLRDRSRWRCCGTPQAAGTHGSPAAVHRLSMSLLVSHRGALRRADSSLRIRVEAGSATRVGLTSGRHDGLLGIRRVRRRRRSIGRCRGRRRCRGATRSSVPDAASCRGRCGRRCRCRRCCARSRSDSPRA